LRAAIPSTLGLQTLRLYTVRPFDKLGDSRILLRKPELLAKLSGDWRMIVMTLAMSALRSPFV
jgi:hypothetical protein